MPPSRHYGGFRLREAEKKTDFAAGKRAILRGKTTEVIDQIPDGELDLVYINGDHTLKGIAIDLQRTYPKVGTGGFLGSDDFTRSVWQHGAAFEPTLVFPLRGLLRRGSRRDHLRAPLLPVLSAERR